MDNNYSHLQYHTSKELYAIAYGFMAIGGCIAGVAIGVFIGWLIWG